MQYAFTLCSSDAIHCIMEMFLQDSGPFEIHPCEIMKKKVGSLTESCIPEHIFAQQELSSF